jgi:hypothetical protein
MCCGLALSTANMQRLPIRFKIRAVSEELIRFQPIKE